MQSLLPREDLESNGVEPVRPSLWHAMFRLPFLEPVPGDRRRSVRAGFLLLLVTSAVFGLLVALLLIFAISTSQIAELERYRPSTTTELYDVHGTIFGSFALERRVVVPYSEFPLVLRQAILSIEDKNFESNGGINAVRVVEAAYQDLHSDHKSQGASTLTMQLARNLFLSSEKTYGRKLQEIFLALQIERHFTKQQIFTLYANQIYLGGGTYGFEAGSEYYFSKHARDLTLPEAALLAALPKGPEYYSPVRYPARALRRRNLVLTEMLLDGKISRAQADAAQAAPLGLQLEAPTDTEAPYFVEEVRRELEREYGVAEAHGAGLRVYTTLDLDLQRVANKAVLDGLAAYERRHGWKGSLPNVLTTRATIENYKDPDWNRPIVDGAYFHALVMQVKATKLTVRIGSAEATLTPDDWAWTEHYRATDLTQPGDLVYVKVASGAGSSSLHLLLEQDSGAQGSLMAVDNADGEVLAMVGGRDFARSQYNRATQSERQVGSSFKPYVYTAAMEAGMKPYDTVLDVPTTFSTPGGPYTPHDYEASYLGPMTLVDAFAESRNIPALRLADKVGIRTVIATAHRFGITSDLPSFLPVAIGAAGITLAEQVGAYSVFPNDGIRIAPHFIRRVASPDGQPLQQKTAAVRDVISTDIARKMMVLFEAVVQHGTGAAAAAQLHHALGGKTGTTNNYTDAWFVGFSPSITCGTWVGFDNEQSLGEKETGARAALPIWISFMKAAVAGKPNEQFSRPDAPKKHLEVDATAETDAAAADATPDEENDSGAAVESGTPAPVPIVLSPARGAAVPSSAPSTAPTAKPAPRPIVLPPSERGPAPPQAPAKREPQPPSPPTDATAPQPQSD